MWNSQITATDLLGKIRRAQALATTTNSPGDALLSGRLVLCRKKLSQANGRTRDGDTVVTTADSELCGTAIGTLALPGDGIVVEVDVSRRTDPCQEWRPREGMAGGTDDADDDADYDEYEVVPLFAGSTAVAPSVLPLPLAAPAFVSSSRRQLWLPPDEEEDEEEEEEDEEEDEDD